MTPPSPPGAEGKKSMKKKSQVFTGTHALAGSVLQQDDFCNIPVKTYVGFSFPAVGNQHFYKEK